MLGDKVTIGQSLIITIFNMTIVFLALLIIAYLIKGLQNFSQKNKNNRDVKKVEKIENKHEILEEYPSDEELVIVIAAAIAASMKIYGTDIKIKSIKRIPNNTLTWSQIGREEQVFNRL